MSFIEWLMLGLVAYAGGFGLRYYRFGNKSPGKKTILALTAGVFGLFVLVFIGLNFWALKKPLDLAFVGVSALVATFIFYYGLTTDNHNTMNPPD
ncbi:hypothetical protein MOMA_00910 [Moraxella macacae 0408225]|uniref:Uncharacterized protein n=1 Tax=Moraxella macacae 0408225 TaxID=1230338 RepID=L2F7B7_9GAMM|nr:hypothetical protein [Moraxella macacae]ELA08927.1 hypothetical protein MOMA_00910 [Moraxella macacae 0408225]